MSKHLRRVLTGTAMAVASLAAPLSAQTLPAAQPADPLAWPAVTPENKIWSRWWWMGNAVDPANLTRLMEQYQAAGIGGLEICPIYGAHGYENRFIDFLSPQWMEMLAHTTREAQRLRLGLDMTTGTGWPFGGPTVSDADASARIMQAEYRAVPGATISETLPAGRLQTIMAYPPAGDPIDLTDHVKNGKLDWTVPTGTGQWHLYAITLNGPVQKVKRAAPGGEGNVLDPFSTAKLDRYLDRFDKAFAGFRAPLPRAQFHDSYEYYNANWTDDFLARFQKQRGYDLRTQLPALWGQGEPDISARVKCDYRETLAELHTAYMERWTEWCHRHNMLSRNQAHGAPANLVDLYAVSDIPETEIFARYEERHMSMLKFASSAAHLKGARLTSAESFTWLGEHFNVPLSQVKPAADFFWLSGINHLFFHGIPYSPDDAPWPGFQFYAAVNFGPQGGLWRDFPAFNAYVARVQSILQAGKPANDVLLYFPVYDLWQSPQGMLVQFTTPGQWMAQTPFYETANALTLKGYSYDEVSDRFLAQATTAEGAITLGGNAYRTILVPHARVMPAATLQKLLDLAQNGVTVLFQDSLPATVPGFANFDHRQADFNQLLASIAPAGDTIKRKAIGKGLICVGNDLNALLQAAGVPREPMADAGLRYIRRLTDHGYDYFIVNNSEKEVDAWLPLGVKAQSAVLLDPMFDRRAGVAALRQAGAESQVRLQLAPGETRILRTSTAAAVMGPAWPYTADAGQPIPLAGRWKVEFIDGGPTLPKAYETADLKSWTTRDDPDAQRFAGTARYTLSFDRPAGDASFYLLDLGTVAESARVTLNGASLNTLFAKPFYLPVTLAPGRNTLQIEVTNLAANRIRDMDQRKVNWKYFYDANLATQRGRGVLDASTWPLRDSGLLGPVTLRPQKSATP